jgi:alanine-synthesizing transaminase
MGNPDQPTPEHIVEKLVEAARRSDTHRYSASRGIPRLRCAISNWYKNRFDVAIDAETEAIVTIGSKEGLANLAQAVVGSGDTVLVPNPCTTQILCSLATLMTRSKNPNSAHSVVGLDG